MRELSSANTDHRCFGFSQWPRARNQSRDRRFAELRTLCWLANWKALQGHSTRKQLVIYTKRFVWDHFIALHRWLFDSFMFCFIFPFSQETVDVNPGRVALNCQTKPCFFFRFRDKHPFWKTRAFRISWHLPTYCGFADKEIVIRFHVCIF